MAYDPVLASRLAKLIDEKFSAVADLQSRKMFGGIGYLLNGNMCFGVHKDTLMVRVGVEAAHSILKEAHVRPMDLTGKVMKGWATVEPQAIVSERDLRRFCALAIDFVKTLPAKQK